ncbi:protein WVD2-like 7 isoform X1 [Hibiscus syriacus]|uniref:protein WVD2-like 7 isoform X1 n=1 Tax=Hibiscus syriacus TaxID=106335 RepID=UPI00192494F6|nr:protein WVD2-like 7 isoform X1 [Hibiscus syriacus]XP_038996917.1 protein WVD2-like 7 isoform X1 [Hibiscus syriacus]
MGDSACLMQPFSYTAGIPNDSKEGNPVLGQSISFGRFMSESLSWDKWSTFSHNKYVEEAERYARPGSVAQKKAFFEAHYKTLAARKAAALLEQAKNSATINATETEAQGPETGSIYECKETNSEFVKIENRNMGILAASVDEPQVLLENNMKNQSFEKSEVVCKAEIIDNKELELSEGTQMEKPLLKNGKTNQEESEVTSKKKPSHSSSSKVSANECDKELELSEGTQMEKPLLKNGKTSQDEYEVTSKRRPSHSSSKVSANARTSKVPFSPAKFKAPLHPNNGNNLTPMAKKSAAIDTSERKRPTPKSSHKSINFSPAKELSKSTSTSIRKIDGSRIDSSSKASKECPTPLRTPSKVSISGKPKQSSATPWSENRSGRTPVNSSASISKTACGKWSFLPTDCSRILSGRRNKSQSPGIFVSFSLRTEERAARRKQRLEEKFNVTQEQKVQQRTTLKEKAGTELKKLRQSFCFKARPLPDFYKERTPKDQIQKVTFTKPETPALGRKSTPSKASISERKNSLPHRKSSIKNTCFMRAPEKRERVLGRSLAAQIAMTAHENTSPNIQNA